MTLSCKNGYHAISTRLKPFIARFRLKGCLIEHWLEKHYKKMEGKHELGTFVAGQFSNMYHD